MKRPILFAGGALAALSLIALGYLAGHRAAPPRSGATGTAPAIGAQRERRVLYWYDPMVPGQHFARPGLSPMGMQLVPKYAAEAAQPQGLRIDPRLVENLGIRTAEVVRRRLPAQVRVSATVAWDLTDSRTISARADGIVTRLDVRAPYTRVAAGQSLGELLAPAWGSALEEYAALRRSGSVEAGALRAAAHRRLVVLGLTERDIRDALRDGHARPAVTLRAPQAGIVTTVDVREGQRVSAGQTLMTLNGLRTVWIEAAIPQADVDGIEAGTPVTVTVDADPGRTFRGAVEQLLPQVDPVSRTERARIVLDNPDGALAPGMFATVSLQPKTGPALPVVPDGAVIATGVASRVIVADADGHFHAVPVRLGRSAGGYTEILKGLDGAERVVVSGQFLIDSEASLSGALDRL